jgi:fermentation-respiration switch protein FrsA (DUF1100 family)
MPGDAPSIHTTRVTFDADGETIVGLLRAPSSDAPHPALVLLGPLTSVKEQVPGHYADALARRGFVTLAFDNRHFGESGGQPRQYEHPGRKLADVRAALTFLGQRPEVAEGCLGALGVCAGAGYMSAVVAEDPRIRAFGAVAGFFHDVGKQREWMGERFDAAIAEGRAARERYETTGQAEQIPAVGREGDVAMPLAEAFEYYGTERGAHPNYVNAFAIMSREHTLPFDARGNAAKITAPTLMIHSEHALAPALARAFFADLRGSKTELWVESKGQIDFYDDPALIEPAADRLAEHFRKHLPG